MNTLKFHFILRIILLISFCDKLIAAPTEISVTTEGLSRYKVHVQSYQMYFYKSNFAIQERTFTADRESFSINLPSDWTGGYLNVYLEIGPEKYISLLYDFWMTGGEYLSIQRRIDGKLSFTGSFAEMASVQHKLRKTQPFERAGPGAKIPNLIDRMDRMSNVVDSLIQLKSQIVLAAEKGLKEADKQILLKDVFWQGYSRKLEYLYYLMQSTNDRNQLNEWYARNLKKDDVSPAHMGVFPRYLPTAMIYRSKIEKYDEGLPTVFKSVSTNYSGELREQVLTQLAITDFNRHDSIGLLLNSLLPSIKNSLYKSELTKITRRAPGVPAFNFSLIDTLGKTVRLSDFKGKYVLMDFWFWGCGACRVMADSLKALLPSLDGKPVSLISVNIDTRKEDWLSHKDKYAPRGAVELNCNFKGADCDLIKYYDFLAYPQLVLIDPQGKIVSVDPDSDPNVSTFTEIKKMLYERQLLTK